MSEVTTLPPISSHVHFIGIGGIGMSGLARMLLSMGYSISGSDSADSALIDELREAGIPVSIGHAATNVPVKTAIIVRTSAVDEANPEMDAATRRHIPVIKRAELLGAISSTKSTIAVAGTHGKSTTSAMVTTTLMHLGQHPSYAIGAVLEATGTNASLGSGELMVVEADEYDHSFLRLTPSHAIITNAEFDHPDIFLSKTDYEQAFVAFASLIAPGGRLVLRGDDPGSQRIAGQMAATATCTIRTFGLEDGLDWSVSPAGAGWHVRGPDGSVTDLTLPVPGEHNALNAVAAIALLGELGFSPRDTATALATYRGIGRRFERKGEINGILVIDDYAHHPTEVEATLKAALARYPNRRIWAVFQPHTFSRTVALLDAFATSLSLVEHRVILDVYGARERNDGSITEREMRILAGPSGFRAGGIEQAAGVLAGQVRAGDVVLTLGAGTITELGPILLERIAGTETLGS